MLLVILLCSCTHSSTNDNYTSLFDPTFNLTVRQLEKDGFTPMKDVDVFILEKNTNDTLVYFQFGEDVTPNSEPATLFIKVPFKGIPHLKETIEASNSIVAATKEDDYIKYFYVKNLFNNLYFECTIRKPDTTHFLVIFDYPILK